VEKLPAAKQAAVDAARHDREAAAAAARAAAEV